MKAAGRVCIIYAWICPETSVPVYVGKTSAPLDGRHRSHFRQARTKPTTPKHVWLKALLDRGLKPLVRCLEICGIEQSSARERAWVERLSTSYPLLNKAAAGAGNPGVGRVRWTPEALALLGTMADSDLAKRLGCERKTVSYRRECLGIAASFDRTNSTPPPPNGGWNRIVLADDIVVLLGTMPDAQIGAIAGVSRKRIMVERASRGIASFAAVTGNDGRIKAGEPHRRWTTTRRYAPSEAPKNASAPQPQI